MSVIIEGAVFQPVDERQKIINRIFLDPTVDAISTAFASGIYLEDLLDIEGRNLFFSVCASRKLEVVKFLLEHGVSVNETNSRGRNGLMYMAECQSYSGKLVNLLLDDGLRLNHQDNQGITALMLFACGQGILGWHKGNMTAVMHLLRRGADLYLEDSRGLTVYDHAVRANERSKNSSNQEIVDFLKGVMRPFLDNRQEVSVQPQTILTLPEKTRKTALNIGPRILENQIREIEKIEVNVVKDGRRVRSDSQQFKDYHRKKATSGNMNVATWKSQFCDRYPGFEAEVYTKSGGLANGNTLLRTLRS